ncbi:histidine kinase dimerization/phospho-acceptor domain-containing protein [Pseudoroseomonas wenyumeiae]
MLQESAEDLYEEAPFGYLSSQGVDGPILRLNRTLCRWTGYQADQIIGVRRLDDLLSPAGRIVHATRHVPLLQTAGAVDGIALELLRADRSRLPVLMSSVVRRAPDGGPLLTRTTLFDATAYRRYEARLVEARDRAEQSEAEARRALAAVEAADRAKARFLAAMNHEFRTPIGIINGFAGLLLEAAEQGQTVPTLDWTRDILGASTHLLELLEDATRYARLADLERNLELRPVNLRRAARLGSLRTAAALERERVAVVLNDGEDISAELDEELFTEAVACTLRELAHRVGAGAELHLRCLAHPPKVEICCSNTLLSPQAWRDLLAPLDAPTMLNRGLEGAGLGIAVAHRIVALHGGRLSLEGDADNGNCVTLSFGAV